MYYDVVDFFAGRFNNKKRKPCASDRNIKINEMCKNIVWLELRAIGLTQIYPKVSARLYNFLLDVYQEIFSISKVNKQNSMLQV